MLDSNQFEALGMSTTSEECDAIALARLPELINKLEEAAYAFARRGESTKASALFVAVATISKYDDSEAQRQNA